MYVHVDKANPLYKLRFLVVALLVIGNIFLFSLVPSLINTGNAQAQSSSTTATATSSSTYDSPNVVADGMAVMASNVGQTVNTVGSTIGTTTGSTLQIIGSTFASTIGRSGKFVGNAIYTGTTFTVRSLVGGVAFVARIPANMIGSVTTTPTFAAVIKPADTTHAPIVGLSSPTLAVSTPLPTVNNAAPAAPPNDTEAAWPIHGAITTLFGVPHWPYQPTHTGIDISDGQRAGVTPIKPFKPGRVVDAIRSNTGLGNHITIDHGGGITSVYGHLASIAVQPGQNVDKGTVLGFEGSTGASTGTHLHFEIRLNGQPVDPRQHINSPL